MTGNLKRREPASDIGIIDRSFWNNTGSSELLNTIYDLRFTIYEIQVLGWLNDLRFIIADVLQKFLAGIFSRIFDTRNHGSHIPEPKMFVRNDSTFGARRSSYVRRAHQTWTTVSFLDVFLDVLEVCGDACRPSCNSESCFCEASLGYGCPSDEETAHSPFWMYFRSPRAQKAARWYEPPCAVPIHLLWQGFAHLLERKRHLWGSNSDKTLLCVAIVLE